MAFVVQCPFCNLRARVPHRAEGANGKCPRCAASFTLAPADDQNTAGFAHAAADAEGNAEGDAESHSSTAVAEAIATATAVRELPCAGLPPALAAHSTTAKSQDRIGSFAGALALAVCGLTLLCTWMPKLCILVLPLGGLGLLIGAVGIALAWSAPRRGFILPIAGGASSSVVLLIALLFPALLGPTYQRSRLRGGADPTVLRAVPIGQAPLLAKAVDWVDASQYALQRGELLVQVVSVIDGVPASKSDPKAKSAKDDFLLIRVRLQTPLNDQKTGEEKAFDWSQNRSPTLTDSADTSYSLRETRVVEPSGAARRSHLFPISTTDQIFVFAAPAKGWKSLRLEVPGAAWGAEGVFRFTIPATMLLSVPPGAANSPPNGGG